MGRNSFRFYVKSGLDTQHEIITPRTLTFQHGTAACVIECRLPERGERTWQCWTDAPLAAQIREVIVDWGFGGDPPGIEATGNEENDKEHEDGSSAYYVTILAAFDLGERCTLQPHMLTQPELMKAQGFTPGAEARAANARDALAAKLALELREDWKAAVAMPEGRDVAFWLNPIAAAMNRMEEIGGPHDADYLAVMEWVATEAARRANVLSTAMSRARFKEGDYVEVTHDCEIGKAGERARVDRIDGKFIRLTFHMDGRSFSTGADYKHLRKVGPS